MMEVSGADIRIRPMEPGDLDQVEALERLCFSVPWSRQALAGELCHEGAVVLAAVAAGEIAGYAGMRCLLDEGEISNVAVNPALRRRGIAGRLIQALTQRARELGVCALMLEVRASNLPAIRLYERYGFTPVGRRRGYYTKPPEDALLMTAIL